MDSIDHKIINALAKNARMSMANLAEKIGLSKTPTQMRGGQKT